MQQGGKAVAIGQGGDRLRKGKVVSLHDELKDIPPRATAKAIKYSFLWANGERRGPFGVEGTQPFKASPSFPQRHMVTDHFQDVGKPFDLLNNLLRNIVLQE